MLVEEDLIRLLQQESSTSVGSDASTRVHQLCEEVIRMVRAGTVSLTLLVVACEEALKV